MTMFRRWGFRAGARNSSDLPAPYMSAVSKKVMPASMQALTTSAVRSASSRPPKLLQPRPTSDTLSPDFPRLRYSTYQAFLDSNMGRGGRWTLYGARHVRRLRDYPGHLDRKLDLQAVLDPKC